MSFVAEEWPFDPQQFDDDDDYSSTTPISRQSSESLSVRALGPASSSHAWAHTQWFEHEDTQGVLTPPSHSLSPSKYEEQEKPSSRFDIFDDYFSSSDGGMDDSDYVSSSSSLSSPPITIPLAQAKGSTPNQRKPLTTLLSNTLLAPPSQARVIPSTRASQRRYSDAQDEARLSFPSASPYGWAASVKQPVKPLPPPPSFVPPSSFLTSVAFPEIPTLLHPDHRETENEALSYKPRGRGLGKQRPKGW